MVESILHFFKIHRKVIFGNPAVIVQHMLRIAPKTLNAVDMVLAAIGERFAVVQPVVFAQAFQGVVTAEGVGVVDRSFSRMLSDVGHELIGGHPFNHLGVYPSVALQKAEYNAFSSRASAALAFAPAAKVRLVNLDFSFEFARLKFGNVVDRFAQMLVYAAHCLIIHAKIRGYAIRGLLLVKAGDDANLFAQTSERLLLSTALPETFHISAFRLANPERTAENALSAPQKVGRTVENVVSGSNHKGILPPRGYETH